MLDWFKENWVAVLLFVWVLILTGLIILLYVYDQGNDKVIEWALASESTVAGALLLFLRGNKPNPPSSDSK